MRSMTFRAVAALLLFIGAAEMVHASAIRLDAAPNGIGPIKPARRPLALDKDPVTVVVQLAGDPVSVQQAKAGGSLAEREKEDIRGKLRTAQAQLHQRIAA